MIPPDVNQMLHQADALMESGRHSEAVVLLRQLLAAAPGHVLATLALGGLLIDMGRPVDAETVLRGALHANAPPRLKAALHTNLAMALRRQRRDAEAMAQYDAALALDATLPGLDVHRAEALQNLQRYDEALAALRASLAREPRDPGTHRLYNDLLYRLDRHDDYLRSYDRAPVTRDLLLGKASFLSHSKRHEEALEIHMRLLGIDGNDRAAAIGASRALRALKDPLTARRVVEAALVRRGEDAALLQGAAACALEQGDAKAALDFCVRALALDPRDQTSLAAMGTALRMLDDARDEELNGYDSLIRVMDLKVPEGFSRFEDFNAALCESLARLHPRTREYVTQSLRGGTQTPDNLFGAGHDLVERLERSIANAVQDYVASLPQDDAHPFVSRRSRALRYAGSWSSRLADRGFHVNHIHPEGWISSCYYVDVPQITRDQTRREGWIKFGEPGLDVALKTPVRRAVQPVPGQLVLFPSYMWHGTNPFHEDAARTTIAFDVIPAP